jgi:phage shock protein C
MLEPEAAAAPLPRAPEGTAVTDQSNQPPSEDPGPVPAWSPDPAGWSAPSGDPTTAGSPAPKRLYRSRDRIIGGVCGGVAAYLGVDASLVRVLTVLSLLLPGPQILAYLVAWVIVPEEPAVPPPHRQPPTTPPAGSAG